ncbi:MAG: alkaline shock response membrane anchor protein AmaP [Chloroflexota bacterium]|nr:alkaline shock response membrane anchor protein AmaP [Chloroflexota bacterium]
MLNMLNRVVTILALLTLIACSALAAMGVFLPATLRDRVAGGLSAVLAMPETMAFGQQIVVLIIALLIALVAFALLVLELRPSQRGDTVRVKTADGGVNAVARDAIRQRVQFAVDRLDDVIHVEPAIEGGGRGLRVHLNVTTSPYIDVPMKSEEIRAVTREVIEKQMGLILKKVTVTINHEKYQEFVGEEMV